MPFKYAYIWEFLQKNYKYKDILIEPVMLHVIVNISPNFSSHTTKGGGGGGKETVPLILS